MSRSPASRTRVLGPSKRTRALSLTADTHPRALHGLTGLTSRGHCRGPRRSERGTCCRSLRPPTAQRGYSRRLESPRPPPRRTIDRDLQTLSARPLGNLHLELVRKEATNFRSRFASRISDSTSSDFQEESELSSEERDALIEGVRTPLTVCRNRLTKFGARKRIVAASTSREHFVAGDRLLGLREHTSSSSSTIRSPIDDIRVVDELREEEEDIVDRSTVYETFVRAD